MNDFVFLSVQSHAIVFTKSITLGDKANAIKSQGLVNRDVIRTKSMPQPTKKQSFPARFVI